MQLKVHLQFSLCFYLVVILWLNIDMAMLRWVEQHNKACVSKDTLMQFSFGVIPEVNSCKGFISSNQG